MGEFGLIYEGQKCFYVPLTYVRDMAFEIINLSSLASGFV